MTARQSYRSIFLNGIQRGARFRCKNYVPFTRFAPLDAECFFAIRRLLTGSRTNMRFSTQNSKRCIRPCIFPIFTSNGAGHWQNVCQSFKKTFDFNPANQLKSACKISCFAAIVSNNPIHFDDMLSVTGQ